MGFNDLTIKTRISASLIVLTAATLLVSVLGLGGMKGVVEDLDSMFERRVKVVAILGEIRSLEIDRQAIISLSLLSRDAALAEQLKSKRRAARDRAEELLQQFSGAQRSDEGKATAKELLGAHHALQPPIDEVDAALAAGNFDLAARLVIDKVNPAVEAFKASMDAATAHQFKRASEAVDAAHAEYSSDRNVVLLAAVIAMLIAAAAGFLLLRSIMSALREAISAASRIAAGKLGNPIDTQRKDELGALLASLSQMDQKLHGIVGGVRNAAGSVGAAASQLSRGNDDLSQRTQEQAAALEQTASSMEEMTTTVKQNADNARQANQLAVSARNQAERGGGVVTRTVEAMEEINKASSRIADIIGVIDEIAFQTNLLALNAAVEAARAGEQGRGFAVVASEVRSLAQRSAAAAREIKDLIGDSTAKVRAGSELVDESGAALREIMESVKKVSDIVAEIAAASEEQASGIDQVNHAVTQMDHTTQQNAALVEEATAAAKSMEQQARELLTQIAFFSGAAETAAQAGPAASAAVSQFRTREASRAMAPVRTRQVRAAAGR